MSPETATAFRAVTLPALPTAHAPGAAPTTDERAERSHAAGWAAGWAAGTRAAAEQAAEQERRLAEEGERALARDRAAAEHALDVLARAAAAAQARVAPVVTAATTEVVEAVLALAAAVVGHELADAEGSARSVLSRVLAVPAEVGVEVVRVAPADLAAVEALLRRTQGALPDGVRLVADPALAAGDVVCEHPAGYVDGRLVAALDRARAALLEDR